MQNGRNKINKEETDDCSIDINDIANVNLNKSDSQADSHNDHNVNNLTDFYFSFFWFLQTYDTEHSFPK